MSYFYNPYSNIPIMNTQSNGLTQSQFDYLAKNYSNQGFIADSSRINNYTNPVINVSDRNWQEKLYKDSGYKMSQADYFSYKKNCEFGPHNAGPALDAILFKK